MMQYSRQGLYIQRKKKTRISSDKEKPVDWVNIFLFVLLFVVIILFVVT